MKKNHIIMQVCFVVLITCLGGVAAKAANNTQFVTVTQGHVRATIPGTTISSAYMTIHNNSEKTVTLHRVSSKISPRVEIHQHSMKAGMMTMQQLDSLTIDGQSQLLLQPGGLHLMIFDVIKPLQVDDTVELTLHFLEQDEVIVQLPVQSIKHNHHH